MKNTAFNLREYQSELFSRTFQAFTEHRRVMLQLPTGGGKTVLFSSIAQEFTSRGDKVLVLAHRTELIEQAADKLKTIINASIGIIKAGIKPDYDAPIQVASVQSLIRRLHHLNPDEFGLIIVDEAHHSTATTYRTILEYFPDAYQLGVTATPIRTNGKGFADLFDELITGVTVGELIKLGHLSPFKLYAAPKAMVTRGVKVRQGDYSSGDVARLNNVVELAGDLLQTYCQHASGLSCVVFAVNVEHSMAISSRYNAAGIPAKHLDGESPKEERREVLEAFKRGEIKVISNVGLFTEGLDIPSLEVVQIARPTKSLGLWLQMVGRVLRPFEGKDYALIIDHTANSAIHGLPTRPRVWSLLGVEQKQEKLSRKTNGEMVVEIEEKTIQETKVKLIEVQYDDRELTLEYWNEWLQDKIRTQQHRQYKKLWLYYRHSFFVLI